MIDRTFSQKILTVGPDCKDPKGGIGMVLKTYSTIYEDFRFICTHKERGPVSKTLIFLVALCRLIPLLCDSRIRIVHVHGASKGSFVRKALIIILSRWSGKKIVYHIHGGGFKDFYHKHMKAVGYILRQCDTIVALSDAWRKFFQDELGCPNVVVVPNVMEAPHEDHTIRRNDLCTLLFLGKVCDEKGIFDLLDVICHHPDTYSRKVRLLIGGNGDSERLKTYITDHHLESQVSYAGWVNGEEKIRLLNSSDIFVLPSYYEGVPISLLEAFSYHLPVITTPVGGIPDIVDDGVNGFLVPPGDQTRLHEAITRLMSDQTLRESFGQEAYQRCRTHLPEEVEKLLTNIYKQLLNHHEEISERKS